MALTKRIQKFGGGRGLLLSSDIRGLMNIETDNDEVVMEVIGDTLLVRKADAPKLTPLQILAGLGALEGTIRRADGEDMTEPMQWFFLMIRAFEPATATELAKLLGRDKRYVMALVRRGVREGTIVKDENGIRLADEAFI